MKGWKEMGFLWKVSEPEGRWQMFLSFDPEASSSDLISPPTVTFKLYDKDGNGLLDSSVSSMRSSGANFGPVGIG